MRNVWRVARVPGVKSHFSQKSGCPRCLAFGHLGLDAAPSVLLSTSDPRSRGSCTDNKIHINYPVSTGCATNPCRISAFSKETANSLQPCPSFH